MATAATDRLARSTSTPDQLNSRHSEEEAFADAEPPPPYSSMADGADSTTLEANFSRPYEVQDSGAYNPPSRPPPSSSSSFSLSPGPQSHYAPNRYPQPAGPPPPSPQRQSGSYSPQIPIQHPTHQLHQHDPRHPQPHRDGVSTFNRPALPNQPPAHTQSPAGIPRMAYSPTSTPTGGQPLLLQGKLLVYPADFYCSKCHNTGYRAYDPSMPHMRCWDKYSRQYNGVLRNSPNFDFGNATLQRPLPSVRPQTSNTSTPPQRHSGYYVAGLPSPQSPSRPHLQQQQPVPYGGYQQPQYQNGHRPQIFHGGPPAGALVVQPGDPRIGGQLCYECGGRGQVAAGFLLLDYDTCPSCRGTGRVFS
ncbi:MAG: hypothetical protein CYPHOPRED_000210 [Cyphobasidiales sp. Tagirdzhanova-0007]|nr:MAG: hypothetical protein CYPHOPRED_000210 [Cyphobasidiales sp. Tagirdzhanova-0007]